MASLVPTESIALAFQGGGSDKVWAAALVSLDDGRGLFLACWGRRGAPPQAKATTFPAFDQARKQYTKKVDGQLADGYQTLDAADASASGVWAALAAAAEREGVRVAIAAAAQGDTFPGASDAPATHSESPAPGAAARIGVSHVLPLAGDLVGLEALLDDAHYGVSEKANGQRCVIVYNGTTALAYNRRGVALPTVPRAARAMMDLLQTPCVLDGEWMADEQGGGYVAFDLLALDGADVRACAYAERIARLERALLGAGVLTAPAGALASESQSTVPGFALLRAVQDAAAKRAALAAIRAAGGEGVILRALDAAYAVGDTRTVQKVKFQAEVDVVALGIKPGVPGSAGSVRMGLYRPDGTLLEIGTVRSGLTDGDVRAVAAALARGEQPVLVVTFLPVRTVGFRPVEPKARLRTEGDKAAGECTTQQLLAILGADRAPLIAAAPAARIVVAVR
jgi:predicted DNA-binding WGR domain protein